jgi:hypothetical protein
MADEEYKLRMKNTGRNDTCPCGSGKKYKKCHLQADEEKNSEALAKALEEAAAKAAEAAEGEEPEEKKEGPPQSGNILRFSSSHPRPRRVP